MKITRINLMPKRLQLKRAFSSSHETLRQRELTIVEVVDESGWRGYGELEALSQPFYTSETQVTARWIIEHALGPLILNRDFQTPQALFASLEPVKENQLAKAAIDMAVWDLFAKMNRHPLADALAEAIATERTKSVKVGISIGIQDTPHTIESISRALEKGYGKVKLKLKGNADLGRIFKVAEHFAGVRFCLDANGSLSYNSALARQLDQLHLIMIEDPFGVGERQLSAKLQSEMKTSICYDEPIESVSDAVSAVRAGECRIISMKASMIGGLTPALAMIKAHQQFNFPIWCGGLLEGGVGRAANLALASLKVFAYPGDISETARYYVKDLAVPEFRLTNGTLTVPDQAGIGVTVSDDGDSVF